MTSISPTKLVAVSAALLSSTFFFLLLPPHHHLHRRLLLLLRSQSPPPPPSPSEPANLYSWIHSSLLSSNARLSLPLLSSSLLFHFYFLIRTARDHFSPSLTLLSSLLRLSPSLAAVTLLSLGNGAPDLFSSSAALRHGLPRAGLAAIISAGAFVSAAVVGSVSIIAAPFPLDPAPFVRDVFFYILAVSGLFYLYLSAEIYLWQAVGMICFYAFFVGLVFWMDFFAGRRDSKKEEEVEEVEMGLVGKNVGGSSEIWDGIGEKKEVVGSSLFQMIGKVTILR